MPRKPRNNQTQSFYHVILRGNNKQAIFFKAQDYVTCLKFLQECTQTYQCKIHLFCFMTNHIHLLLETGDIPLRRIMQAFSSRFAKYLNKTYDRVGHIFQGRYKAKKVATRNYFLELIYYIHNNPVAANIVMNMSDYPWSSHNNYNSTKKLDWLTTEYLIKMLLEDNDNYSSFIENFKTEQKAPSFCLFESHGLLDIKEEEAISTNKNKLSLLGILSFKEICEIICKTTNFECKQLDSPSQSEIACLTRSLICFFAHFYAAIPINHIALQFDRHYYSLSRSMYKTLNNLKHKKKLAQAEHNLLKMISEKQLCRDTDELNL